MAGKNLLALFTPSDGVLLQDEGVQKRIERLRDLVEKARGASRNLILVEMPSKFVVRKSDPNIDSSVVDDEE